MPSSTNRMQRIGDQIQQVLAQLLISKTHDPRLKAVCITEVRVSPDMGHANILVTFHPNVDITTHKDVLKALNKAAGFFRKELAHMLNLRVTPHLHFVQDKTTMQADHLIQLINQVQPNLNISNEQTEL